MPWKPCNLISGHGQPRRWHIKAEVARKIWEEHYGERFEGEVAMHLCDEGRCGEPSHIVPGSYKDNTQDAFQKGRMVNYRAPGEKHPAAKLTDEDVLAIRLAVEAGVLQRDLAAQYGVARSQISRIVNGRRWSHVGGGPHPVD